MHELPEVTLAAFDDVCEDTLPFALTGGSPEGGVYFGDGVDDGEFDPALAGTGTHVITYEYTDENGCTGVATETITVNTLPVVVCPDDQHLCENDLPITLAELDGLDPTGGVFTILVDDQPVDISVFDPADYEPGTYQISYIYEEDTSGCTSSCTFTITVHPTPIVTCPEEPIEMVMYDDPLDLTGLAQPEGGIYEGPGVEDNVFHTETAGPGVHTITYEYTDEEGCSNFCTFVIVVEDAEPELLISKTAVPQTYSSVGDEITYTFTVTNNGNVTLTDVVVTDPLFDLEFGPIDELEPGDEYTFTYIYTITQDDMDAGSVVNTATATGFLGEEELIADDTETITADQQPAIALSKSADPQTYSSEGDEITYTFTVTNNGNVTLTDLVVNDPLFDLEFGPIEELEPGEELTFTYIYSITQEDVDAGSVVNTATATGFLGEEEHTAEDSETITADQEPEIALSKNCRSANLQQRRR